jgi:hypothetical protein
METLLLNLASNEVGVDGGYIESRTDDKRRGACIELYPLFESNRACTNK